jgi:hypothetical protein
MGAVKRVVADRVVIGNVEMRGVPLNLGSFKALRNDHIRRNTPIDGFLSAGFLRTCSAVVDLHNLKV